MVVVLEDYTGNDIMLLSYPRKELSIEELSDIVAPFNFTVADEDLFGNKDYFGNIIYWRVQHKFDDIEELDTNLINKLISELTTRILKQ